MDLFRSVPAVASPRTSPPLILTVLLLLCPPLAISVRTSGANRTTPLVPALIMFGDSIIDPGNNNHVMTVARSNFRPYGQDFPGHRPTGRFSNGRIPGDLIASALGIKEYLPPYYKASLTEEDLLTGVSFASAAAGFDADTSARLYALSMTKQLELFREYKRRVAAIAGQEKASKIFNDSLYVICAGSNDIANNYFGIASSRKKEYDAPSYAHLLLRSASDFVSELLALGARRIGVVSALPVGCVPAQRALQGGLTLRCADAENEMASLFNAALFKELQRLQQSKPSGTLLVYIDLYTVTIDLITNPSKYGFDVVTRGCCGTGTIENAILCNRFTPVTCPDVTKYVFWDGYHPTERAYEILVDAVVKNYLPYLQS